MKDLTKDILPKIVLQHSRVVVQYGASWCSNCRLIKPKFKEIAERSQGDILFMYVDAEQFPESRRLAEVNRLPTFVGFVNGKQIARESGSRLDTIVTVVSQVVNYQESMSA